MAFDYQPFVDLSKNLTAEFGRSMLLRRHGTTTYDTSTGSVNRAEQHESFRGVPLDRTRARREGTVTSGTLRVLAYFSTPPAVGDKVFIDQVEYVIEQIEVVQPACPTILVKMWVSGP